MKKPELINKLTKSPGKILITAHDHPDADGIGSQIALGLALLALGKQVLCVNEKKLRKRYKYLDKEKLIMSYSQFKKSSQDIATVVVLDTNTLDRIGPKMRSLVKKAKSVIFIDHHPVKIKNKNLFLEKNKCATGEVVGNLIEDMGVKFNFEIALCLYTAILIDTSSFRYPNVSGNTHRLLGKLIDAGVDPPIAYNMIYGTKSLSHVWLLGKILSSIKTTRDQRIAYMVIKEHDLKKYLTNEENTNSFINHLLILKNIKVACLFRQEKNRVKVSLRSHESVDVNSIAQELGGGGHLHSAGLVLNGNVSQIVKQVIEKISSRL